MFVIKYALTTSPHYLLTARIAAGFLICYCLALTASCGRSGLPVGAGDLSGDQTVHHDGLSFPDARVEDARPKPDFMTQPVEGLIYLEEIRDATSTAQQGYAWAFFAPPPHPFFKKLKSHGSGCWSQASDEVGPVQYDAGRITISGGPYTVKLETEKQKKPDDWLYPAMLFPDFFGATTTLKVTAAGKALPPFSGQVKGVGDLQVTFPTGSASRTKPLTLTFKPAAGLVQVIIWGVEPGKKLNGKVVCTGLGLTGKLEIPAAALAAMPKAAYAVQLRAGLMRDTVIKPTAKLTVHLVTANLVGKTYALK